DEQDTEEALDALAEAVARAGADALFVHARKAWLEGLSPKENRDIPALDYERVYRLKRARLELPIAVNGGVKTIEEAKAQLAHVDGVMMGRAAYQDPELLLRVDPEFFGEAPPAADAFEALDAFEPYVAARLAEGVRLSQMTRHILGLFAGRAGARAYRRHLATEAVKPGAGLETLRAAVDHVRRGAVQLAAAA
ncbi:MAG TPA: tRNA-dihydrouridine synthase, partial [Beijerinckiaceae bacterium]|nr:tRNA-dihydrouridine synthase [Beijerinckiaceae bacterium]